jgi:5-methylcytosine-specific restriction endonuclease McrA
MVLDGEPCLVLNGDYSPLNICTSLRAVKMIFSGRAEVVEGQEGGLRTVTHSYPIPTVIRVSHRVPMPKVRVRLSRKAVLSRDRYVCQYCGTTSQHMTVDHLIPKNKGGKFTWENLVCACPRCNSRKGDYTPSEVGMTIRSKPREPGYFILSFLFHTQRKTPDSSWGKYLPPGLWRLADDRSPAAGRNEPI